jgi:hypothetical protein
MAALASTAGKRPGRTSLLAYTQFNKLARHIVISEHGRTWTLTKAGLQYVQKAVDACMLALLDVAVATQPRKTLTCQDINRARQFCAVFTGLDHRDDAATPFLANLGVVFPQKFGVGALKKRHPALYVQSAAAVAMTNLYGCVVRTALRELDAGTKKRMTPNDVCAALQRMACLSLVPPPPAPKKRASNKRARDTSTATRVTKKAKKTSKKKKKKTKATRGSTAASAISVC